MVFYQVEEALLAAGANEHGFDGDYSVIALFIDLLPVREVLPLRGDRAEARVASVRQDDERVVEEDLRDRVLVVAEVVVESVLDPVVGRFEFHEEEREQGSNIPAAFELSSWPNRYGKSLLLHVMPIYPRRNEVP